MREVDTPDQWWTVTVCLGFLIGLLLYSSTSLSLVYQDVRVRPSVLLALPVIGLFVLSQRRYAMWTPNLFALLFLCLALVGTAIGPLFSLGTALTLCVQLLLAVGLFILLSNSGLSEDGFRLVIRFWVGAVTLVGLIAVCQVVVLNVGTQGELFGLSFDWLLPQEVKTRFGYARPYGVFSEPSFLATAVLTGIMALLPPVAVDRPVLFDTRIQWASFATLLLTLLLSGSFAGYLTFGITLCLLAAFRTLRSILKVLLTLGVGIGVCAVLGGIVVDIALLEVISGRIMILHSVLFEGRISGGSSIYVRTARYIGGLTVWGTSPLVGVGLGQYADWVQILGLNQQLLAEFSSVDVNRVHGGYIQVLVATGISGLGTFLLIWATVLGDQLGTLRRSSGTQHTLVLIAIGIVLVNLVNWLFTFSLVHIFRWGLIGLVYGYTVAQTPAADL
jgi:O-antigen ligase